jgi:hypothetical protein
MELPRCPACERGHLLPMSSMHESFSFWVCSVPDCTYVVSSHPNAVKYFKGHAISEPRNRGEKSWTEFEF